MIRTLPLAVSTAIILLTFPAQAQIPLTTPGATYNQNFDTLANTGTTGTALPTGWAFTETGTNADTTYGIGTGSSTTGNTYSFGAAASTERAFGTLLSGSLTPLIGACFVNNTGVSISTLGISYTGEQWRNGGSNGADRLEFAYSVGATSISTGTYTAVPALNFSSRISSVTAGALDGNLAANRLVVTADITGLTIATSQSFCIRWVDINVTGSDDGLAVDDFNLTPNPAGGVSTNPSASGTATSVLAGTTSNIAGTIIAGTNPTSASYTVSCNLSAVGDSNPKSMTVNGNTFSGTAVVAGGTAAQTYVIPCTVTDNVPRAGNFNINLTVSPVLACGAAKTLISAVQGSGSSSPLVAGVVELEGIVTGSFQPTTKLGGFYLQEPSASSDGNPATSEGIFIEDLGAGLAVNIGDSVRVRGTVAETFNQTVLNSIAAKLLCGTGFSVTPTDVTFPLSSTTFLEQYEGMLVRFPQQLRVTDNYDLGRFNEITLAFVPNYVPGVTYTRLMSGTQVAQPGAAANAVTVLNALSSILLDDGSNLTYGNLLPTATYPLDGGGLTATNTARLGDRVNVDGVGTYTPLVGVLGFGFSKYRFHPTAAIAFGPSDNPRPITAPAVGGRVRAVSANVLNYFTTYTSVNSNARGADNQAEFLRQRDKVIAAIKGLDAHVVAISELENLASLSIQDMVNDVNGLGNSLNAGNPGKWAYIDTGVVGTDAIRVAFLYQPAVVQPVGLFKVLDSALDPRALTNRNRPAIAQTFQLLTGPKPALQHFTVVANHFKSKGSACTSAPADPDLADGQDNCNLSRLSMATALIDWLATNPTSDPTPAMDRRFLILGDLNAHLKEDPISAMTSTTFSKAASGGFAAFPANANATYKDLVSTLGDPAGYSYLFSGESGALDHALANPALFRLITGVSEWHINADEPVVLDYNSDYDGNGNHSQQKSAAQLAAYYTTGAFRTSDHDPLLVGFNPLPGDLNDDGIVNLTDQALIVAQLNRAVTAANRRMDYDGDGKITLNDYRLWVTYYRTFLQ